MDLLHVKPVGARRKDYLVFLLWLVFSAFTSEELLMLWALLLLSIQSVSGVREDILGVFRPSNDHCRGCCVWDDSWICLLWLLSWYRYLLLSLSIWVIIRWNCVSCWLWGCWRSIRSSLCSSVHLTLTILLRLILGYLLLLRLRCRRGVISSNRCCLC